MLLLYKLGYTI